ncbi:ATP-binding cassette domain-containing protein [Solitalea lacus]|uniref:ABC transporter ATP-binding protein n=1 Tax=Solitalea lacus TaxID=2911172 RepID=UPI001EDB5276|nr:ABC transporter ATP-binding protein [Solitalea lacus]UKJ07554.1 ABC transporter ATP-binding protein [Solitalea lacus]
MITINHLNFGYHKRKPLFTDLNLELKPGHIYGLLGKNGAGKSSLLRLLCGLLFPKQGEITAMSFIPGKRQPAFLEQVFFVPEEIDLPHLSVQQYCNVNGPFYSAFSKEYFYELLKEFEVDADAKIKDLSYGQRKKLLIAFAVATNAKFLVMDEPTNGLDIPSKSQFRKIMAGVIDEERCIVISTHQVRDLDNLIDAVIILDEGSIVLNDTMERISERLLFTVAKTIDEHANVLYQESSLAGYLTVAENQYGEDSKPDMELLFNAATENKQHIRKIFNN